MPDNTWQQIGGRYYLIRRYDYRNAVVYFAMDVGNSIQEQVAPLRNAGTVVYVADGSKVMLLTEEEAV